LVTPDQLAHPSAPQEIASTLIGHYEASE
jgi:hypothetical protein